MERVINRPSWRDGGHAGRGTPLPELFQAPLAAVVRFLQQMSYRPTQRGFSKNTASLRDHGGILALAEQARL